MPCVLSPLPPPAWPRLSRRLERLLRGGRAGLRLLGPPGGLRDRRVGENLLEGAKLAAADFRQGYLDRLVELG